MPRGRLVSRARGADQARPGGDRQRARRAVLHRLSSRRSPAAPASVSSTPATSCEGRRTRPGIVILTQLRPISVLFQPAAAAPAGSHSRHGRGPAYRSDALTRRRQERARPGQAHGGRQPGRSDHRHGEAQRPNFPTPISSFGPRQFVNVRVLIDTLRQVVAAPIAATPARPQRPVRAAARDGRHHRGGAAA